MRIKTDDVVRLKRQNKWFSGLLMIVEEVREWGITGFVPTPQGDAPLRIKWDDIETVWHRSLDS